MKIDAEDFQVPAKAAPKLKGRSTRIAPFYGSHRDYEIRLGEQVKALSSLQERLYATNTRSLLLIFQAMDAAGKDGVIKHVMSGVNPQGCQVFSFKHPGPSELQHDFLWRFVANLPEKGRIGIFNRSYYEEVLIARVHPQILQTEEHVPSGVDAKAVFKERYRSIRHLERHLVRNGTHILKFYLHLSKEEQRTRFLERIDHPDKNWKLSLSDMQERRFWDDYMRAYEHALSETNVAEAPWHVVPADDKPNARLIVSAIIVQALEEMKMRPPTLDPERASALTTFRAELEADAPDVEGTP
jgi:PPK2 family polyphosphate:nucleotide phosphotransferase